MVATWVDLESLTTQPETSPCSLADSSKSLDGSLPSLTPAKRCPIQTRDAALGAATAVPGRSGAGFT